MLPCFLEPKELISSKAQRRRTKKKRKQGIERNYLAAAFAAEYQVRWQAGRMAKSSVSIEGDSSRGGRSASDRQ